MNSYHSKVQLNPSNPHPYCLLLCDLIVCYYVILLPPKAAEYKTLSQKCQHPSVTLPDPYIFQLTILTVLMYNVSNL